MNKKESLFSKADCLSLNEIMNYIHDRVSLKERNRMERHLIECELCNDAVEGYSLSKNEKLTLDTHQTIQKGLVTRRESFGWEKIAAIFAATLIIGGLGYYLNMKLNNQRPSSLANGQVKENVDSIRTASSKVDTILALETNKPNGAGLTHTSSSDGLLSTKEDNDKNLSKEIKNGNIEKVNTSKMDFKKSGPVFQNDLPNSEVNAKVSSSDIERSEPLNESSKEEEQKSTINLQRSVAPSQINDGIPEQPNMAKSKASSKKMKADVLDNSLKGTETNYLEEGKGLFNDGKYKEAINLLIQVDQQSKGYEESLWYLGLSYVKLNEMSNAKLVFKKVKQLNGKYKDIAEEELKKLK